MARSHLPPRSSLRFRRFPRRIRQHFGLVSKLQPPLSHRVVALRFTLCGIETLSQASVKLNAIIIVLSAVCVADCCIFSTYFMCKLLKFTALFRKWKIWIAPSDSIITYLHFDLHYHARLSRQMQLPVKPNASKQTATLSQRVQLRHRQKHLMSRTWICRFANKTRLNCGRQF